MAQGNTADAQPWVENRDRGRWRRPHGREVWAYRELLGFLAWRDLAVRYKQASLGVAWGAIQPLVAAVLFTFVFGRLARIPSEGVSYPVFAYAGLVGWTYAASSITHMTRSLVANMELVTRVYVPRVVVPLAAAVPGLVELGISLVVLAGLMAIERVAPGWQILLLPGGIAMVVLIVVGVGLWTSALHAMYRDTGLIITFAIQVWLLASPVAYPLSIVEGGARALYVLNPMVGAIGLLRWSLVGTEAPGAELPIAILVATGIFVSGVLFFSSTERRFADVI